MQQDYDNTDEMRDLDDQELHRMVRDRLADDSAIDADDLVVEVRDGRVRVSGRVGTDSELRIADHILSDGLGLGNPDSLTGGGIEAEHLLDSIHVPLRIEPAILHCN